MKLQRILILCAIIVVLFHGPVTSGHVRDSERVNVKLITDEAEAVLAILEKRRQQQPPAEADWQRLFTSDGYVRLKRREASMQRAFTDDEFKAFVMSEALLAKAPVLKETLDAWKKVDVNGAANRALTYLPQNASIRAKIFPMIKPRENSFVFEVKTDPAILLYLNPNVTKDQFDNTLAHELHHIGYGSGCPGKQAESEIARLAPNVRETLKWVGGFGEGFAMLAAAGGPNVHPHQFSEPADRARWDHDMINFNDDLRRVDRFFADVLAGRGSEEERTKRGFSFFGVQGPWYTVGWKMAVLIERTFGRATLIDCMCDQRKLLATYNAAATKENQKSKEPLAILSAEVIEKLKS